MKKMLRLWLFALCSTVSFRIHAAIIDANVFYFTDATSAATDSSNAVTAYAFYLGFALDKKGNYLAGWNFASYSTTAEADPTTIEYSSTQMGPAFVAYLNKDQTWRVGLAYNLKTTADYDKTGSTAEEWRGTGISGDIGYQLHFSESFSLGIRLNYSQSTYSEKVVGAVKTDVSYTKNLIYPSLGLTFTL